MADAKGALRDAVAAAVAGLDRSYRNWADGVICERVGALAAYADAVQLVLYQAVDDEVSLDPLAEKASRDGKRIYLPCTDRNSLALEFRSWRPGDPLRRGYGGILEPVGTSSLGDAATLSLVPGRAFDERGGRLGRGRGCYDRAMGVLSRLGLVVGIAYSCQLTEAVPVGALDCRVSMVVTEDRVSIAPGC
ncbi:MAG: 5-formyltetrahydrofolate cyclo-ligase [Candidatus Binatia bacterium]